MTKSNNWEIKSSIKIPYGHPHKTLKQKVRKWVNTLLWQMAYSCPFNSLRVLFHRWRGCHIGKGVYIGRYCYLDNMYPEYIYIYDGASINAESMILTHFNPFETWKNLFVAEVKPTVIGENSIVSVRCTILPGVSIGKFSVVSNGMTIEKSIPDYTMCTPKQEMKQVNIKRFV